VRERSGNCEITVVSSVRCTNFAWLRIHDFFIIRSIIVMSWVSLAWLRKKGIVRDVVRLVLG